MFNDGRSRACGASGPARIVSIIGLEFARVDDWGDRVPDCMSIGLLSSTYYLRSPL